MDFSQLHCPMSYAVYKFQPELGEFSACCDADPYKFNLELFNALGDKYFEEYPTLMQRKADLLNNIRHSDCNQCWQKEDDNVRSMRINFGPQYTSLWGNRNLKQNVAVPSRIELWMNSTCNLGCFMCHLGNSNTLRKIWYTDYDSFNNDGRGFEQFLAASDYQTHNKQQEFVDSMVRFIIKSITEKAEHHLTIAYLGGEPTLHSEMYEHADLFIEAGRARIKAGKELKIEITTNGTSKDKLNERFYILFEKYKAAGWLTSITLSQDGADDFAQVRHGADFQQISKNYSKWIGSSSPIEQVNSFTVITGINLPYINHFARYLDTAIRTNYNGDKPLSIQFNALTSPKWMQVKFLPKHYALNAVAEAKQIFEQLAGDYSGIQYNADMFNSITDSLKYTITQDDAKLVFDKIKHTNSVYQKTYPEWDFFKQFPHLTPFAQEYGIEI